MNAKITLSALGALAFCSCQNLIEATAKTTGAAIPFGDSIVYGVVGMCSDVKDVCVGDTAPRKDELANKKIVFLGTLEEDGNVYQIRDVVSFQHSCVIRMTGGIRRLNKVAEVRKQGVLPASAYVMNDLGSLSYYERTGGATAIFKESKENKEGEKYTLTFASSEAGTYTYENIVNGVLIGKGEGTFDVEDLGD